MRKTAPTEAVGSTIDQAAKSEIQAVMSVSTKEECVCAAKPSSHSRSQWRPSCCWSSPERPHREPCPNKEELGKNLFFDTNLSTPTGQACAACHGPEVGYTGPDAAINAAGAVYEGAVAGRFGNRKPPSAAYAGDSPILHWDGTTWVGGMFWDGRATGWTLGDPLAEQALGPFLNPLEQNNASAQVVIDKVLASSYKDLFLQVCTDSTKYYECIGRVDRSLREIHGGQPVHFQVRLLAERAGQVDRPGAEGLGAVQRQGEVRQLSRGAELHRLHLR